MYGQTNIKGSLKVCSFLTFWHPLKFWRFNLLHSINFLVKQWAEYLWCTYFWCNKWFYNQVYLGQMSIEKILFCKEFNEVWNVHLFLFWTTRIQFMLSGSNSLGSILPPTSGPRISCNTPERHIHFSLHPPQPPYLPDSTPISYSSLWSPQYYERLLQQQTRFGIFWIAASTLVGDRKV